MSYTVYGGELSLFTRKLEAAMVFYGAEFVSVNKAASDAQLIEARSGTHQVPVLLTPENWMIADTTPLLRMLDGRFPGREMFPPGGLGLLVHVLEEFFDEWVSRVMVHYRWHYAASAEFAARRMTGGDEQAMQRIMSWGPRACRATGTESPRQRQAVEAEYLGILRAAEDQLQRTAFLCGDRPTALDCIVLGGLRAHTNMDPDPKRVVAAFPTVVHWAEHRADQWDGHGELAVVSEPTPFACYVLEEMADTYGRFVLANRDAQTAGAKAFHVPIYDEDVSYLSRPYPEQSRLMVVDRRAALGAGTRREASAWLDRYRLAHVFA